jgi:hypothetical protein
VDNHLPSPPSSCCYARCHGDVADSNKYERSDLLPGPRRRSGHAEGRPTALVAPGKNKSLATASRSQRHVNSTLQLVAFLGRHASVFRRQGNRLISPKCPRIGALEEGSRPSAVVRGQRRSKRLRSPVRPSFHWGAEDRERAAPYPISLPLAGKVRPSVAACIDRAVCRWGENPASHPAPLRSACVRIPRGRTATPSCRSARASSAAPGDFA